MHPLMNIGITAARCAGEIIMKNFDRLDRIKVISKSENDFFSEVDVKAEQAIINTIHKAYPEHGILAEESGYNAKADDEVIWIIDPLDGTTNYLHGLPHFAVSIAVQIKNRVEHAIIFDPVRQEFFQASRGRGAQLNDRRMRVSKQFVLKNSLLGTGFPHINQDKADSYFSIFSTLCSQSSRIRKAGSAALDLAYVASGRLDGFWGTDLKPWDIAAGSLLIKEAGGLIGDFNGDEKYLKNGDVVCGNPKIFKALLQSIKP